MFLWILIALQFFLAAALVLSSHWSPFPWLVMLLAAPGALLAIWAWFAMGMRRIRIHPIATTETVLLTRGPYAIVRHPMYTGLLWFTAAMVLSGFAWWRLLAWYALVVVLHIKATHEEKSMTCHFDEYADYQRKVGKLLPKPKFSLPNL